MFEKAMKKAVKTYKWMKTYSDATNNEKAIAEYKNKLIGQVELMEELFDIDSEDIFKMIQERA